MSIVVIYRYALLRAGRQVSSSEHIAYFVNQASAEKWIWKNKNKLSYATVYQKTYKTGEPK